MEDLADVIQRIWKRGQKMTTKAQPATESIPAPTAEDLAWNLAAALESWQDNLWRWQKPTGGGRRVLTKYDLLTLREVLPAALRRAMAAEQREVEIAELKRQLESAMNRIGQQSDMITTLTEQAKLRPAGKPKRRGRR